MGYNPFSRRGSRRIDAVVVGVALVAIVGLMAWAILGG